MAKSHVEISDILQRVDDINPKKSSIASILTVFGDLIELTDDVYNTQYLSQSDPKALRDEFYTAIFIQYLSHKDRQIIDRDGNLTDRKILHDSSGYKFVPINDKNSIHKVKGRRKSIRINEGYNAFIEEARKYIYTECKLLARAISSKNDSIKHDEHRAIELLDTLAAIRKKNWTYYLESKVNRINPGLITALRDAFDRGVTFEKVGNILRTVSAEKIDRNESYPKFREYWDITKKLLQC
jgi:hypothetical protein